MLPNSTESETLLDIGPGNLHLNNSPKILSSGYVLCPISLFSFSNSPCCPEFPLGPLGTQICTYQIPYKPSMSYQTHPSNYLPYWKCGPPWRVPFSLWSTTVEVVNTHIPQILWSRGYALCTSWSLLDYYDSWSCEDPAILL